MRVTSTYIKQFEPTDPRLGRHVRHDERSLAYLYPESSEPLVSIRHHSMIPTLDQGQLGSCTGNAATKCLSYAPLWNQTVEAALGFWADPSNDEKYAVGVYSAATALDAYAGTYPPNDTGSDGLSVAKVLQQRGLISGYTHSTSLKATLSALAKQPAITGLEWREDMFNPDPDGRLRITGAVAGGHEFVLDELDVENQRIWMQNSWSDGWGVQGRGYFTYDDFATLLQAQGDVTVFTPITQPAPTPTPPPADPQAAFIAQAEYWMSRRHTWRVNTAFEKQLATYIDYLKGGE